MFEQLSENGCAHQERAKGTNYCPVCYREARIAETRAKADEMKARAQALGLAELSGSEAQVLWALSLRDKALREMMESFSLESDDLRRLLKGGKPSAARIRRLFSVGNAKWWISHKQEDALKLAVSAETAQD